MTIRLIKTKLANVETAIKTFLQNRSWDPHEEMFPSSFDNVFFIAGGAIASLLMDEKPDDFDIYFTDQIVANRCKKTFTKLDDEVVFISDQAITIKLNDRTFQLILGWYGDAEAVTSNFDFVHTKGWYKDGHLRLPDETLISILTKELFYTGSDFPLASFIRVRKFLSRGWTINAEQLLKIALDVNKLDLTDPDVLQNQLQSVEIDAIFDNLIQEWIIVKEQVGTAMGDGMAPHTSVDIIGSLIDNKFGINPVIE